jgi:hypothetical protein
MKHGKGIKDLDDNREVVKSWRISKAEDLEAL